MADYYPLLARAAAGLTDASPDARQAMYARARKALLGQLGAMDPPLGEEDIARESVALDEAIARVEADLFSKTVDAPAPAPPASPGPFSAKASSPPATTPTPPASTSPFSAKSPATPPTPTVPEEAPQEEAAAPPPPPEPEKIEEPPVAIRPRERPPAPTPPEPRGQHSRLWILGGVVAIVVAAVAAAALKLRNSPDELARLKPVAAPTVETAANGKIAERVGRDDSPATVAAAPAARGTPTPASSTSAPTTPTVTQAPIPVAQRAALLIEAPDLESKVRTFLGSTVWRLDNVPTGTGQPIGTAVHADVEVPEAKVRLSLDMKKNTDPALPAASTIEVRFTLLPGSIFPGISQIAVPQMRREENPNGDALAGVPVKITDTYFLVGLAQGEYASRNNDLMRSRGWIDIPIQLSDNRIAKIALEKGAIGDRIVADALATWAQ